MCVGIKQQRATHTHTVARKTTSARFRERNIGKKESSLVENKKKQTKQLNKDGGCLAGWRDNNNMDNVVFSLLAIVIVWVVGG